MEPKARAEGPFRECADEGWEPDPVLAMPPGSARVGGVGVGFATGVVTGVGVGVGVGVVVVVVGGGVPTLTTGMIGTPTGMWLIGNSGHPCRSRCLWGSSTLVGGVTGGSEVGLVVGSGSTVPGGVLGSRVLRGPCGSCVTGRLGSGTPIGGSSFLPVGGSSFLPVGGSSFGLPVGRTGSGAPLWGGPGLGSQAGGGFGFGSGKRGEPAAGPCISGFPEREPEAPPWRTTRPLWTGTVRAERGKLDAAGVKTSPTSVTAMAAPPLDRGWLSIVHQDGCVTTLPKTDHCGLWFDRQLDLVRQR
jgi:hypothetical protein